MSDSTKNNQTPRSMVWFPWLVCGLGALFYSYEYFLRITPSVIMPDLMRTYGIDAERFAILSAFYYYAYTPMQLPVGVLMDRYGPRRLLTFACLVCVAGSYIFVSTGTYALAGFGRFLVGFGSAFAFVGVLKLATIWLPPERFALIAGLTSALGTIGAMAGDILLTKMVHETGWRATTLVFAVVGLCLAFLILFVVRDNTPEAEDLDTRTSQRDGHESIAMAIFNMFKVLLNPQMWVNGAIGCLLYLPTTAFAELWGIPYLETAYGFSDSLAALANSTIFLGFTVGGPLVGFFSDRLRNRRIPLMLGGIVGACDIATIIYAPNLPHIAVFLLLFLLGFAYSVQVIVFAVSREISPESASGSALAVTNMFVMIGGILATPIIGKLLDLHWSGLILNQVHVYSPENYRFALAILPLGLLLGAALVGFIKETHAMNLWEAEESNH
ncbi:MAG: MFS transporter [Gammaproteobacteria bacterium]